MTPRCARAACAALALVAAGLSAAPSGAAVSRPHRSVVAAGVNGAAAADGGHLVAWGDDAGLNVLDDRAGTTISLPLYRPCDNVYALDGSDGVFLVNCRVFGPAGTESHQLIADVASGTITPLPSSTYRSVGTFWAQGTLDSGDREDVAYFNWRTGETRLYRRPRAGQIYTPFDLNTPNLDPVALAGPEFVTGPSVALEQVRRGRRYAIHVIGPTTDRVVYRSKRRSQLISVKGGLALWRAGSRQLFGFAYRSGRRYEWRMSDSAVVRGSTERRVYYLTPKLSNPQHSDLRAFAWR